MLQDSGFKVVAIDEGNGPLAAIKDPGGRILTPEQVDAMRHRQETELAQATDLRDRLVAGNAAATAQVVAGVREGLIRQLAALDRQKLDLSARLTRLEGADPTTIGDVVNRMVRQLGWRVEMTTAARDRLAQVLAQVACAIEGMARPVVSEATVMPAVE